MRGAKNLIVPANFLIIDGLFSLIKCQQTHENTFLEHFYIQLMGQKLDARIK